MYRRIIKTITAILSASLIAFSSAQQIQSQQDVGTKDPKFLTKDIGIDQKLGAVIPKDVKFTDEDGREVALAQYLGKKPVILIPVFFTCASACSVTLEESVKSFVKMKKKKFALGQNYDVITFSINPKEDHNIALIKKNQMLRSYKDPTAGDSWHFLTGSKESIDKLTKAIGFRYTYDVKKDLIQHAAGIMILTPDGRLSRYFYGTQFEPKMLRDSLEDAASGQIGLKSEVLLFGCLHIDPLIQSFSNDVLGFVKLLGVLTIIILLVGIVVMNRKYKKQAKLSGV